MSSYNDELCLWTFSLGLLVFMSTPQAHESELIFGKGMRTATFQFSECGGSLNGRDLFAELPFL